MENNHPYSQPQMSPPPDVAGGGQTGNDSQFWILRSLNGIQETLGGIKSDISHLSEKVNDQAGKIDKHIDKVDERLCKVERKLLIATTAVITTGVLLSGFIGFAVFTFDKAWDYMKVQQQAASEQAVINNKNNKPVLSVKKKK